MKRSTIIIAITLLMTSISFGQFTVYPGSVAFDPITVDDTDEIQVVLTSEIAQSVTLSGLEEPFSLDPAQMLYEEANDSHTFTVTFAPTTAATFFDTISVVGSIYGDVLINVSGEGTLVEIDVSISSIDFGEVSLGDSSTTSIQIYNNGTGTMVVNPITANDEQFYAVPNSVTIGSGSSEEVDVRFKPTLAGVHSATLSIYSNDPVTPEFTVDLTGTGVTNISGDVSGTWTPENSPYYLVGETYIQDGSSLTILPGVSVINNNDYNLNIYGELIAEGTLEDSIYFISNNGGNLYYSDPDQDNIHLNYVSLRGTVFLASNGYDFEQNIQLSGWYAEGTYQDFNIESDNPHSGSYSLRQYYSASSSWYNSYFTTPTYTVTDDDASISFWYYTNWYNTWDGDVHLYIRVNQGSWQEFYFSDQEITEWTQIELDVSEYANPGDEVELQFNTYWYYWFYTYIDDMELNGLEADPQYGDGPRLYINNYDDNDFTFENSEIIGSKYDGIYMDYSSDINLNIINSDIIGSKNNHGIYTTGCEYSTITIDNSKINEHSSYGINMVSNYDTLYINNSDVSNNGDVGIYSTNSNKKVEITNSTINNNGNYGIYYSNDYVPISISSSEVSGNNAHGIYTGSSYSPVTVENSMIVDNGSYGIGTAGSYSPINIDRTLVAQNASHGVYTGSSYSSISVNYSTIVDNYERGVHSSSSYAYIDNSIIYHNREYDGSYNVYGDQGGNIDYSDIYHGWSGGTWNAYGTITNQDPLFIDEDYHVSPSSPTVDAANPGHEDNFMPPGLGAIRADMGVYGGPGNDYWGGDSIPSGEPVIDNIQDLPQDQGGYVGIQYQGSIFDYAHTAYDIEEYSFWRAMELNRNNDLDFSTEPNTGHMNTRDQYWELVGSMSAQGFEAYGYSAPTLGDSTSSGGIFWSKFLVVAHTDDEDVYWLSEPDSGYSVDNLPPFAPAMLNTLINGNGLLTASWDVPES